ncbi:hypothetical protein SAMN04487896_4520 [Paenibacillus sp. ov031]|uniref:hypothetical protein n=1 Tax=unclassified Paenibacillus TaxID=185978 RepID=UPI00089AF611|nr:MULTISPECIES: hypothetical protein [unclassified Paenibacillus]SEB00247.1 hypothetical protein SAMN03159332_2869 [Paenibacillus sp. 276b]SHN80543.1 hypothetical protein SAMN04487896_4520 [Paenibacillus sp. ov031]
MEEKQGIKIGMPIVGGLLAAVVGGIVWAVIAAMTERELGLIAIVIGALTGYAVVLFSNKRIATVHKAIAVIFALIGILLGKYLTVVYFTSELFSDASMLDLVFDGEMVSAFVDTFTDYFSEPVDLLFIVLAIVSAWQIPGRMAKTSLASDASSSDHAPRA